MTAVSDDFSGTLAAWTSLVGTHAIVGGKLRCTNIGGSTGNYQRHDTSTGSVNCFAQAAVSSTQVDASSNTGVACRMRAGATTGYQVTGRHAADTLMVWRIVAGAETQMNWQTGAQSLPVVWGVGSVLRQEIAGSLIRAKIDGALVGFCVDTTITDGQLVGVNSYNNASGDFGEWDDFAGGALAADGGLLAPYLVGVSVQFTSATGTVTPTIPPVVASGDLVIADCISRDAAQTMAVPGSEGWSASLQSPSQTGLESAIFGKVWGLGGQTDDTTPTFTIGSGTAGWGCVVSVWRNPAHSVAPWTSVASAVVASASSTDTTTTSATRSCPSATHTGTHRTKVRVLHTADDNAILTNSEGALAYGGATHDSTTGNDFAQGCSAQEDVTVTTNTGTATFAETAVGNDISNGITLVLAIPSTGQTGVIGQATESGTAQPLGRMKSRSIGQVSEAGTAQALTRRKLKLTGQTVESSTAMALTHPKARALLQVTETGLAQPVARSKSKSIGQALETGTVQALARLKSRALGQATETDTALPIGTGLAVVIGQAVETSTALSVAVRKLKGIGQVSEVSTAMTLSRAKQQALGQALEVDQALALTSGRAALLGQPVELDTAGPLGWSRSYVLGMVVESDQAFPIVAVGIPTKIVLLSAGPLERMVRPGELERHVRNKIELSRRVVAGELQEG